LIDTNGRFKRAKPRKKAVAVKRVTPSPEAKKAYEDLVRGRDERERDYGRHLAEERKTRR
jgi:ubiquitin